MLLEILLSFLFMSVFVVITVSSCAFHASLCSKTVSSYSRAICMDLADQLLMISLSPLFIKSSPLGPCGINFWMTQGIKLLLYCLVSHNCYNYASHKVVAKKKMFSIASEILASFLVFLLDFFLLLMHTNRFLALNFRLRNY